MIPKLFTIAVALLCLLSTRVDAQQSDDAGAGNSLRVSDIFQFTNIWTIHLSFTPEQWEVK